MKRLMALMGLILIANTPLATATVSDTEYRQMQQMLTQALARIKELEQHHATGAAVGGSGSSKDLLLDLAFFDWQFKQDFHLAMGKIRNRFYRPAGSGLSWDSDWRPEGLDFRYGSDLVYVNTLGTINTLQINVLFIAK